MLILLTGFLFACAQVNSQDQKPLPTQIPQRDAILVGTAWYPEQWPESRREEDLRLMEAANIKVVRMAEFSLEQAGAFRRALRPGLAQSGNHRASPAKWAST